MPLKSEERKKERYRCISVPFSSKLGKKFVNFPKVKKIFNVFLNFVKNTPNILKKVGHSPI